ncbi:nestin [Clarias gariepinus]|uniref:nestin n=1 Tax=Clarias gariepinus TaxID=13013 RepID=UPI00234CB1FE|nr:nestin [Clarias gariepinus]
MEISSFQHTASYSGEEKYEMLELNRRLESYLNHVKLLEEENQLLWGEVQAMRRNQDTEGQRKAQGEALRLARKELQDTWREKDHAELEVSILLEEIEELNNLREKEKSAQAVAKRKLEASKKALEDERRMQIWLREQAAHLEKEVSLQVQAHQEDVAALKSSRAFSKPVLMAPQQSQTLNLQGLGKEYSQRAAQAWHEAAGVYQTQINKLEERLDQTRVHMTLIKKEKKESQLQVQDLAKELESAKAKRELMEKNIIQLRQKQNQDLQHLQAHVEALEAEKVDLGEQIGELLGESRSLLKMKMSLSLEVATYRALLDSENMRVNNQSASKKNRTVPLLEGITKSPGIPPGTQAIPSCLFSSMLNTTSRSITHKANLMTPTPTKSLTLRTPHDTLKRPQTTKEEEEVIVRQEKQKLETSATISENYLIETDSHDHYKAEEEPSATASISASEAPQTVDEPHESILIKEDLQQVLKAELGPVLFNTIETAMTTPAAGHPQTPESLSSSQHIEETKSSEDGDEEETEVSTEMAQISHAPMSAWEETAIPEKKDVVSELELETEDVDESGVQEIKIDAYDAELQMLDENTNEGASLLLQGISPLSADTLSPVEDDSEILTWADVKEDVIHFVEEESLKSVPDVESGSRKGSEELEEKMEEEHVEWPGTETLESHELDIEVEEEENETEQEKKEELISVEEERVVEEESKEDRQKSELMINRSDLVDEKAELVIDAYGNDNQVDEKAKEVMEQISFETDQLVKCNAEERQEQSDGDESLNITESWRTDPVEVDSYAQENTVADTRPLIHYKSDEETDAIIPISHLGANEPSDSEGERDKHDGGSNWSQTIAKRFDTMEDLSEEPELGSMDDIITDESVQTVLESMDEESIVPNENEDMDSHAKPLLDDALVEESESDLRTNSNENSQDEDESKIENYHLPAVLVEKQEESSQLHDWSASVDNKSSQVNEQETLLSIQSDISEGTITQYREKTEKSNIEYKEIKSEGESEDKGDFETQLSESSQEQVLVEEEPCEGLSTGVTHSDVLLFESHLTEEQPCAKEEDVQSNLSMLTHADFTDEFSLHSHPESQTNTNDSDLEDPNSCDEESPNASQCSLLNKMETQQLEEDSASTMGLVSDTDPLAKGLLCGALKEEEHSENYSTSKVEELENKEEQQYAVGSSYSEIGEKADNLPEELENLGQKVTNASHSTLSSGEEFGVVEMENKKDSMDAFQEGALKEECQTNEKENDLHSFFSSSIKEDIWSATKFETAATYDPNDQTETERNSYDSINPNQPIVFEEDWGSLERLEPTHSKPDKDTCTSPARLTEDEGEEQKISQARKVQSRDVNDGYEKTVHVEDSTDEGDSWSSGEE